jgi:hypothetical protein
MLWDIWYNSVYRVQQRAATRALGLPEEQYSLSPHHLSRSWFWLLDLPTLSNPFRPASIVPTIQQTVAVQKHYVS